MSNEAAIKKKEYDKKSQIQVASGIETWVNPTTGEAREFQTVEKKYYGQAQFWKMYLMDFLSVLGIVESKQLDVICYIMENTQPSNNVFIGTLEGIAKGAKVSKTTANTAVQKLLGANFMTRIQSGVYQINPAVMVKGSELKKRSLVIEYNEVKAEEQQKQMELDDFIEVEAEVIESD